MAIATAMTTDYPRSSPAQVPRLSLHVGLLVLRITTGGSLIAWHVAREGIGGWAHIWDKTSWTLPVALASLGFPVALPLAISLVVITLLGSFFMMLGLLTRLSAFVLMALAIVTALLYHAFPATAQLAVLYAGSFLAIALCGPGLFACDRVLRQLSQRRS
jgi:uncharacterized membrane protein YphA (DoxX/SURF4 family)